MDAQTKRFVDEVWAYYKRAGRHDLPWREPQTDGSFDAYKIMVSELMLQQTQVTRVVPKFLAFLQQFPTVRSLAEAPLSDVLLAWNGLGYNRRAKFLWQAAQAVVQEHDGQVPRTSSDLVRLPGIGPNTAGAILAYAYNQPVVFIETNIRTVYIYHFFADYKEVDDKLIQDMVARTVPDNAREWYWALMDYGTHVKQARGNLNKLSKHYHVQSPFVGSVRQVRGQVLRLLGGGPVTPGALAKRIADERLPTVLNDLAAEGLIVRSGHHFKLGTQ